MTKTKAAAPSDSARRAPPPAAKRHITQKDLLGALAKTNLAAPALPGGEPPKASEIQMASTIRLTLDQVDPYDDNPRSWRNEKFLDIKESIRARGLNSVMWVTRRPGEKRYVLAKGGGTRYAALRELWTESQKTGGGNRRFFEIDFNYCDYRGEADLLAAHISENINRADMCFWDKARGIIHLKDEIETQFGSLTFDATIEKFNELGLPKIARSALAVYQFAADRLYHLEGSIYGLTMQVVRDTLQPGYNGYLRIAEKAQYPDFDTRVWIPTLSDFGQTVGEPVGEKHLDWSKLLDKIDEKLAAELTLSVAVLRRAMETLKHAKDSAWEDLLPPHSTPPTGNDDNNAGGDNSGTAGAAPPGGEPGTGKRLKLLPGTFPRIGAGAAPPRIAPDDGDRPPADLVEQVEAEQRARRAASLAGATPPADSGSAPVHPNAPRPHLATAERPSGIALSKRALLSLAIQLASRSKTLDGLIVPHEGMAMGWMVELPADVLTGTPLPPQAKQIFCFLMRASFQLHTGVRHHDKVAGTRFGAFLHSPSSSQQWPLVQPEGGFDFLMSWLIDPEYAPLGAPATRMLTITRDLVANHPEHFMDLGHTLDFQDLQESHQAQRLNAEREALDYYVQNGASPDMVRLLFPSADLSNVRFRPGRVADIDLKTAQRLYDVWDDLGQEVPSDRARYIRLHRDFFPEVSMASLYSAINELG